LLHLTLLLLAMPFDALAKRDATVAAGRYMWKIAVKYQIG
jgi:hypothetical protein